MPRKKPNILPLPSRLEVDPIKTNKTKKCEKCGCVPSLIRLVAKHGAGQFQTYQVYCRKCGIEFIQTQRIYLARCANRLAGKDIPIRN